jgi:hypothetical protein
MFEALFKGVSARFGLRIVEKSIENQHFIFCSSFQNLRLGSINLTKELSYVSNQSGQILPPAPSPPSPPSRRCGAPSAQARRRPRTGALSPHTRASRRRQRRKHRREQLLWRHRERRAHRRRLHRMRLVSTCIARVRSPVHCQVAGLDYRRISRRQQPLRLDDRQAEAFGELLARVRARLQIQLGLSLHCTLPKRRFWKV